jgi:methionyl-tRNA formyltransferase
MIDLKVLFIGKKDNPHCEKALNFCKANISDITVFISERGATFPEEIRDWKGDYIISYLSQWKLPESLLKGARIAAINFHPGSPDYPGTGCLNFALYEDASEYGVTCHEMAAEVDTGKIIAVNRFPIFPADDVSSLLNRAYDHMLTLFYDVIYHLLAGEELPDAAEKWPRKPFTRKQLNELATIKPDMTKEEIERRVRATTFKSYKPTIDIANHIFKLSD